MRLSRQNSKDQYFEYLKNDLIPGFIESVELYNNFISRRKNVIPTTFYLDITERALLLLYNLSEDFVSKYFNYLEKERINKELMDVLDAIYPLFNERSGAFFEDIKLPHFLNIDVNGIQSFLYDKDLNPEICQYKDINLSNHFWHIQHSYKKREYHEVEYDDYKDTDYIECDEDFSVIKSEFSSKIAELEKQAKNYKQYLVLVLASLFLHIRKIQYIFFEELYADVDELLRRSYNSFVNSKTEELDDEVVECKYCIDCNSAPTKEDWSDILKVKLVELQNSPYELLKVLYKTHKFTQFLKEDHPLIVDHFLQRYIEDKERNEMYKSIFVINEIKKKSAYEIKGYQPNKKEAMDYRLRISIKNFADVLESLKDLQKASFVYTANQAAQTQPANLDGYPNLSLILPDKIKESQHLFDLYIKAVLAVSKVVDRGKGNKKRWCHVYRVMKDDHLIDSEIANNKRKFAAAIYEICCKDTDNQWKTEKQIYDQVLHEFNEHMGNYKRWEESLDQTYCVNIADYFKDMQIELTQKTSN